ncbi:MAG: hypothetical protein KGD64_10485 [Candidatus Heimdallarchaeota archaeon]|nr:hypothetical protein [Candidatus Heimdallarchaeota archaeon]
MNNRKKVLFGFVFSILLLGLMATQFSPSVLVKAQTGYIDVYVYDAITYLPISGTNVVLSDAFYSYIDSNFTDITGYCQFSSLDIGDYLVEVYPTGYNSNYTLITIDFEGEGELVQFYQELPYTTGNSFIDVYVYDFETLNPIAGAEVIFFNDLGVFITEETADVTGFFNFTDIGVGTYNIEAYNDSYNMASVSVTIDFDGEAELAELYLTPAYVPGNGFIDVYVYDNITLTPIENADVLLYDEYGFYIDWGMSDASGFYNFTNLGIGDYVVEADINNYVLNSSSLYIDYDGEGEYLMLYLAPFVHTFDILYPSDSQTVEGGLVLVGVDASESTELEKIDVYVNAEYITTISVYDTPTDFFVPVFENGTNTIYLEAYWDDMAIENATVDINSINVIPSVNIKEGDFLTYRQFNLAEGTTYDANFTFTTWLSTFEMLTHYSIHQYDSGGTIMQAEFWLTINVLNGYVSVDPSHSMEYMHFFPFGNLPLNPVIGDKSVWIPWNNLMTVNGSTTWEYTDVWTIDAYSGMMLVYVEKISNIVHYLLMPGLMEMILLNTSIDFLNPYVSDEADFGYTVGDTGNTISWDATDRFPGTYIIYKDSVFVDADIWNSATPIEINVDGLAEGMHTYMIEITDLAGNIASDIVIVTVNPVVLEYSSTIGSLFLSTIMCITLAITLKKRKFQVT